VNQSKLTAKIASFSGYSG